MSWALHVSADALADLRKLHARLQEVVLDELDRLAAEPSRIPSPLPGWGIVHSFPHAEEQRLHVFTLVLARDDGNRLLTLLGIHSASI